MAEIESVNVNSVKVKLKEYQKGFIFDEFKYKFLTSAWGTGKTLALILAGVRESELHEGNVGLIVRKEYTDLRDSTVKDFEAWTGRRVNSARELVIGKSTVMFRHIEELAAGVLQNINLGWFGIEQGEELDSDDAFTALAGRLRKQNSSRRGYVIANANGKNWIYKIRNSGLYDVNNIKLDKHYFATTFDNMDNLPKDYVDSLDMLKRTKPTVYNRLVLNSDDDGDTIDIIIMPSLVEAATHRKLVPCLPLHRIVSIDVARYGNDQTCMYAIENNRAIDRVKFEKKNTMETVGRAVLFAEKNKVKAFAVDEIGVGAGVADRLIEMGKEVVCVNSAKQSSEPEKYRNIRAEIYAFGAELFNEGIVEIDKADTDLIEQLSWARYKTIKSNGLLQVEPKDDIKKRCGKSPDEADAFLNGVWALKQTQPYISDPYRKQSFWVHPRYRAGDVLPPPHLMGK